MSQNDFSYHFKFIWTKIRFSFDHYNHLSFHQTNYSINQKQKNIEPKYKILTDKKIKEIPHTMLMDDSDFKQ